MNNKNYFRAVIISLLLADAYIIYYMIVNKVGLELGLTIYFTLFVVKVLYIENLKKRLKNYNLFIQKLIF